MTELVPANAAPVTRRAWRRLVQIYGRRKARQTLEMIEIVTLLPRWLQIVLVRKHCQRVYEGHEGTTLLVHRLLVCNVLDRNLTSG